MRIVASHKHIRTHPNRREVWAGSLCICLPRLLTAGPRVLAAGCWHVSQFMDSYLSVLIYFCACLSIYDSCVDAFACCRTCSGPGCVQNAAIPLFVCPYSIKTTLLNHRLCFCCHEQGRVWFYTAFIKQK